MSRRDRKNGELNKQLDDMNKAFNSLNDTLGEVVDKMDDVAKISKDVGKLQKVITDQYKEQQRVIENQAKERTKQLEREQKTAKETFEKYVKDNRKQYSSTPSRDLPKSLKDWYNTKQDDRFNKELKNAYEKAVKSARNTVIGDAAYRDSNGNITSQGYKKMQEIIDNQMEASKESLLASNEYKKAGVLITTASDALSAAVSKLGQLLKQGLLNQANAYESTFENISVRTGLTRSGYYSAQRGLNNQLSSDGLRNNIASSEVQQMWNSMAKNGFQYSEADLITKGIDAVLTQKIVPYLDTSSQAVQLLNNRVDGKLFKEIRGINEANQHMVGANYMTEDILNQMLDKLAPMSDKALEDLALGSTELAAYANTLVKDYDLTTSQANSIVTMLYKQQEYGDQIMSSGTPFEKAAFIRNLGLNIYDPKNFNNATGNITNEGQKMSSWLPRL